MIKLDANEKPYGLPEPLRAQLGGRARQRRRSTAIPTAAATQ